MESNPDVVERKDRQVLTQRIKDHAIEHGWPSVAKAFREVVFPHVGWDSIYTELDNVLRKIANVPMGEVIPPNKQDIPVSSLEPPESHFA